ncbi:helix-turn-helix domain-containing protein [Bacillus infantis]|uniref:helix-turn-helix domain-containing protein n=1 Tax=Bacillus infantis TaxID=324767 RepID=UPI003CF777E1
MLTHAQLGVRLKEARDLSGYTQQEAADKLNISRQKLIAVEKGSGPIDTLLLTSMAKQYGFSVDYFLMDTDNDDNVEIKLAFRADELEERDQKTINWARKILINIRHLNQIIEEI